MSSPPARKSKSAARSRGTSALEIRKGVERDYADIFTPEAMAALAALAKFNSERIALMEARIRRRAARASLPLPA